MPMDIGFESTLDNAANICRKNNVPRVLKRGKIRTTFSSYIFLVSNHWVAFFWKRTMQVIVYRNDRFYGSYFSAIFLCERARVNKLVSLNIWTIFIVKDGFSFRLGVSHSIFDSFVCPSTLFFLLSFFLSSFLLSFIFSFFSFFSSLFCFSLLYLWSMTGHPG